MSQPNQSDTQRFHRVCIKVLMSVLFVLTLLMAAVWLWPYDVNQYNGDGRIEDKGFWSYTRYIVVPEKAGLRNSHPESFGKDEGPGRESGC